MPSLRFAVSLKRAMGFEPTTTWLGTKNSTTELRPQFGADTFFRRDSWHKRFHIWQSPSTPSLKRLRDSPCLRSRFPYSQHPNGQIEEPKDHNSVHNRHRSCPLWLAEQILGQPSDEKLQTVWLSRYTIFIRLIMLLAVRRLATGAIGLPSGSTFWLESRQGFQDLASGTGASVH